MTGLTMKRGKNQVLFRFLPGKPVDYNQGNAIALIERWVGKNASEEVNKGRILREVWRAKQSFGDNTRGYPRVLDPMLFQLLEPGQVEAELFPLTFICQTCSRAYSFGSVQQFNRTLRRHRCECGSRLNQLDLIYYHECGSLWAPKVARCKVHGFEHIKLDRHDSNSPEDWRWHCGICRVETATLNNWCPACIGKSSPVYPKPFRQSSVFTPYSITLVNLRKQKEEDKLHEDSTYQRIILADYLGLLKEKGLTFDEARKLLTDASGPSSEKIEKWKKELPPEMLKELLKDFDIDPEGRSKMDAIISTVNEIIRPPEGDIIPPVLAANDYLRTKEESALVPLKSIIDHAERTSHPDLVRVKQFPMRLGEIGVTDAHVLNDLSIASVVYGFTRGKIEDDSKVLNAFPQDKSTKQGIIPIYMNLSHTEAIMLEFDRKRIMEWLKANGHDLEIPQSEAERKAWFLNNIWTHLVTPFRPINDETEPFELLNTPIGYTRDVYRLLHSISHALLSTAATECGLDRNSLAEMIMPSIPAVIIYCSNVQHFQTGGMFTLFENNIIPWIPKAMEKANLCIYDPVCMDHHSSCHACIQLGEISCEHFNHDLGRDMLIGREADGKRIFGFWEKAFMGSTKHG